MLGAAEILALHREAVATPSVSGEEAELADRLTAFLIARGAAPERLGESVFVRAGGGSKEAPLVLLLSHLDTVPPGSGWKGDPFAPRRQEGKVIGLGANDAKASVAAMTAAFLALAERPLPFAVGLALVEGEETKNIGVARLLTHLGDQPVLAAVVGEPTGLNVAVAQKGLLVLELSAHGDACHAAHAASLGARNAARLLARDLVALEGLDFGEPHSFLGPITLEPTVVRAGEARNAVPATATAILDLRTTPALAVEAICQRVRERVAGDLAVVSSRFLPRHTLPEALPVVAAQQARPEARLYGSATLSDWALLGQIPAIKCGPGASERSHTAEEFVFEQEILDGARFYIDWVSALARFCQREAV